jgi:agmatinase
MGKGRIQTHKTFFGLTRSAGTKTLVVVGIPWDSTSSYRHGAAAAPGAIRIATDSGLYNRYTQRGIDLGRVWKVCDHGDVKKAKNVTELENNIRSAIAIHHHEKPHMLFLGGDHFVTYPAFSAVAEFQRRPLSLLYFDAHPDLYQTYGGSPYSHATVVSRILDNKSASTGKVCYVGIRASTEEQENRIRELGLTEHTSHDVYAKGTQEISHSILNELQPTPVYLSIDLDCLDPAYAPGVGNPEPGGLSTRRLFDILQSLSGLEIIAADVVEYSPKCESNARTTAFTSAVLIKEIMGLMS